MRICAIGQAPSTVKRKKEVNKMTREFEKVGKWGECLWGIDENGTLFINEGRAADIIPHNSPWEEFKDEIREVSTIGKITFPRRNDLGGLFKGFKNLVKADLSGFETGTVTDMNSMFAGCSRLEELDLTSFDTLRCKDMGGMFANCGKLTNILLGEAFSTDGEGGTSCGKLAVKEEHPYRRARVISAEGFKVRYHDGTEKDMVIEKQTVPNYRYVIEEILFEMPNEGKSFMSWSTEPEQGVTVYKPGQILEAVDEDMDLYALGHMHLKSGHQRNAEPLRIR